MQRGFNRYLLALEPVVSDPLIRGYFSFLLSLVLITVLILVALSPTLNTIASLKRKVDDQDKIIKSLDDKTQNLVIAQENWAKLSGDQDLIISALPNFSFPQTIILAINRTALESGMTSVSLQFSDISLKADEANLNKLSPINFTLSLRAERSKVRSFLGSLETNLRFIRINNMIESVDPVSKSTLMDISGSGYYFPL